MAKRLEIYIGHALNISVTGNVFNVRAVWRKRKEEEAAELFAVMQKALGRIMTNRGVWNIVLITLAVIGAIAVIGFTSMALMGGMMGGMMGCGVGICARRRRGAWPAALLRQGNANYFFSAQICPNRPFLFSC